MVTGFLTSAARPSQGERFVSARGRVHCQLYVVGVDYSNKSNGYYRRNIVISVCSAEYRTTARLRASEMYCKSIANPNISTRPTTARQQIRIERN